MEGDEPSFFEVEKEKNEEGSNKGYNNGEKMKIERKNLWRITNDRMIKWTDGNVPWWIWNRRKYKSLRFIIRVKREVKRVAASPLTLFCENSKLWKGYYSFSLERLPSQLGTTLLKGKGKYWTSFLQVDVPGNTWNVNYVYTYPVCETSASSKGGRLILLVPLPLFLSLSRVSINPDN